ncbi:MAG: hypothetical protein WC700_02335 [Gemmatimonadaceae bacterium]|jgi:hypothetical protein
MHLYRTHFGIGLLSFAATATVLSVGPAAPPHASLEASARFVPRGKGCSGDIVFRSPEALPTAVVHHELIHALRQCGGLARDVPTAAAFEACVSPPMNPLHTFAFLYGRTRLREHALRLLRGRASREATVSQVVDSLMSLDHHAIESFPGSYRRATQIAAIGATYATTRWGCERFVIGLGLDLPARFALEAARDSTKFRWAMSLYSADAPDIAYWTGELAQRATDDDWIDMFFAVEMLRSLHPDRGGFAQRGLLVFYGMRPWWQRVGRPVYEGVRF